MAYEAVITASAERDVGAFVYYLLFEKKSPQAAINIVNDFEATIMKLELVADSLKLCANNRLAALGYRRINFLHHNYFIIYRVRGCRVIVSRVFHGSQDYEHMIW